MAPRFSVIIPNYNNAATLARAIDSVLAQTYAAHEIIVIDDGSADDSRAVAEAFGVQVIYHYQANAGVSVARNLGASIASGDWLAFLDADDAYFPNRLQAHAEWIADDAGVDFLLGDQQHRYPDGTAFMRTIEGSAAGRQLLARYPGESRMPMTAADFEELIADGFGEIRTLSVPRERFLSLGGFPVGVRIGEDLHFIVRLCASSARAGAVSDMLAAYYIYPDSVLRRNVIRTNGEFVRTLASLEEPMRAAPAAVVQGLKRKLRRARLSLAYAYLREQRKADAVRCMLAPLFSAPTMQSLRDVLSVIRGLPKT